jgi:hypothetical protein
VAEPLALEDPLRLLELIEKLAGCVPLIGPPKYPQGEIPPSGITATDPKKLSRLEAPFP